MRRNLTYMLLLIGGIVLTGLLSVPAIADTVKLAEGTPIYLRFDQELSSKTNRTGDRFTLHVRDDVKVNDIVILPKGAIAHGRVTKSSKAGMFGKAGKLDVVLTDVLLIDDQRVRFRTTVERQAHNQMPLTIGLAVVIFPAAVLFRGKNVVIPEGTDITVYMNDEMTVTAPADGVIHSTFVTPAIAIDPSVLYALAAELRRRVDGQATLKDQLADGRIHVDTFSMERIMDQRVASYATDDLKAALTDYHFRVGGEKAPYTISGSIVDRDTQIVLRIQISNSDTGEKLVTAMTSIDK